MTKLTQRAGSCACSLLFYFEKQGLPPPPLRHMANSPAILQLPEANFDLVRPALSWKSRVVYFKVILPGHPVGYGSAWQSDHMVRAVTVPVGYGDGYFRSMSHKAHVLLRGRKYPVVGRISMDQVVVNIEWESAYNDDEVILIGESGASLSPARTWRCGPAPSPTRS